jgi:hypothetical protein
MRATLDRLGIAGNVLTDRLSRLVGEGILEREQYSERPARYETGSRPRVKLVAPDGSVVEYDDLELVPGPWAARV